MRKNLIYLVVLIILYIPVFIWLEEESRGGFASLNIVSMPIAGIIFLYFLFKILQLSKIGQKIKLDKINFFTFFLITVFVLVLIFFAGNKYHEHKSLKAVEEYEKYQKLGGFEDDKTEEKYGEIFEKHEMMLQKQDVAEEKINKVIQEFEENQKNDFHRAQEALDESNKKSQEQIEKDKKAAETLENFDKALKLGKIGSLKEIAHELPIELTEEEEKLDKESIEGVDNNKNEVRDFIEIMIFRDFNLREKVTIVEDYHSVLKIIKMLQPKNPFVEKSIDEHDIYCQYQKLPDYIKGEFDWPLDFLKSFVLDTQDRKNAFVKSLTPDSGRWSYGEEQCE